jgi:hypothetical protein
MNLRDKIEIWGDQIMDFDIKIYESFPFHPIRYSEFSLGFDSAPAQIRYEVRNEIGKVVRQIGREDFRV